MHGETEIDSTKKGFNHTKLCPQIPREARSVRSLNEKDENVGIGIIKKRPGKSGAFKNSYEPPRPEPPLPRDDP